MDNNVAAAIAILDDLARRLSMPGATCTASEIAGVATRLRAAVPVDVAPQGESLAVVEAVASLAAEVAALETSVAAEAVVVEEHGESPVASPSM